MYDASELTVGRFYQGYDAAALALMCFNVF
jgi:hypothetical protein